MADSLENEYAAALLSMKSQPRHVLSSPPPLPGRREYSCRIRKRNRLIYNDHEDTSYISRASPRKTPRVSSPPPPPPAPRPQLPDRRVAHKIGLKLRNMLKLPKAHRWVCCEWFYSNIDQPLFLGDNEFCSCLKENFQYLKASKLSRIEWCKIRRLMGKPRRCSSQFFAEERKALEIKRAKIRQLQQRKAVDLAHFKDLPPDIPLPLVIGTKATARVRKPQDGLFLGSIDAVDTSNATYRITFDRPGLGTFSIPDYEVLSCDAPEIMPISAFAQKYRPRNLYYAPQHFTPDPQWPHLDNDPLLGESSLAKPDLSFLDDGTLGGFPKKFLALIVRLSKILTVKKQNLEVLKRMHTTAERSISHQQPITYEFQRSYASLILDFEKLNKDLSVFLHEVQEYCQEIAPEQGVQPITQPSTIKEQCFKDTFEWVEEQNIDTDGNPLVRSSTTLEFIATLASLMTQLKYLSTSDYNSFECKSVTDTLHEIQGCIKRQNIPVFKNDVEIHINHIQGALTEMGNLFAFTQK